MRKEKFAQERLLLVEKPKTEVMEFITKGVDINTLGILHDATRRKEVWLIKFIAENCKNIDWNVKDNNGFTPINIAMKNDDHKSLSALLEGGASIAGSKLLHKVARDLKINGEYPNGANAQDKIKSQNLYLISSLKDLGALSQFILNEKDEEGFTPLDIAARRYNKELVDLLLQCGATSSLPKTISYCNTLNLRKLHRFDTSDLVNIALEPNIFETIINIVSHSYSSLVSLDSICNTLMELSQNSVLLQIMTMNATKENYFIELVESMKDYDPDKKVGVGGYYLGDTIVVAGNNSEIVNAESLMHEMAHRAIDRFFYNSSKPYRTTDGKIAYKKVIKEVLTNIAQDCFQISSNELIPSLNADNSDTYQYGQLLLSMTSEKINNLDPIFKKLVETFFVIYNPDGYEKDKEDAEFIVRYPQLIAEGLYKEPSVKKILAPLEKYYSQMFNVGASPKNVS